MRTILAAAMKSRNITCTWSITVVFLCSFLLPSIRSTSTASNEDENLPGLNILSPFNKSLLWNDLELELELVLPPSIIDTIKFEVCLNVTGNGQPVVQQCFPATLSGTVQSEVPLTTQVILEIEDSGTFTATAYINGCSTSAHCQTTIIVNICRQGEFGVLLGGAHCKANWNSKNSMMHNNSNSARTPLSSDHIECTHNDLTHQCSFPSESVCFDPTSRSWWADSDHLEMAAQEVFANDPSSFLDVFVGPYALSSHLGVAVQWSSSKAWVGRRTIIHHPMVAKPIVPYMRHVFFHAVADNAFQIFATMIASKSSTSSSAAVGTVSLLLLAKERQKYDFLLDNVVGEENVFYLGDIVQSHLPNAIGNPVHHCFDRLLTGIMHRDQDFDLATKDLIQRHRFNIWGRSTIGSFGKHMLMAAKVLFPTNATPPHLTMLVHRLRSETQSLPGEYTTAQIRRIVNQDSLWRTVQTVVETSSCDRPRAYSVASKTRAAVHVVLEDLSFASQLELLTQTEIFIHMHGSAGVLSFFLPRGASFLELRPHNFIWTTWALELAVANDLLPTKWINSNKEASTFPTQPYEHIFETAVLEQFKTVPECNASALLRNTGIHDLETWCQQYFRDQHTFVDLYEIREMLKLKLKKGLFCS
jgi:hypothetical protein